MGDVKGTGSEGSRTFVVGDEDHTLGNAIRHVLMQDANVEFAGYSAPHPMEPSINIRVQTKKDERQLSASSALAEACRTLSAQCEFMLEKVEEVLPEVREDRLLMESVALEMNAKMEEDEEEEVLEDEDM